MKILRRCKLLFATVLLVALLTASLTVVLFAPQKQASALTGTNVSSAVQAGDGAELWDATDGGFNDDVLNDLVDKLFGDEDPVEYIKSMKDTQTDSYVVPASAINAKVGNTSNGLVVKLDGKMWMAASLTLADIEDEEDNVVLTLYLADDLGSSQYYTDNSNVKGNNMYSSSTVRNHLLTNSNWALFQDDGEESFAHQFLVQPKYIKYQHTETQRGRTSPIGGEYHLPNDALDAPAEGWHTNIKYASTDSFKGAFSKVQSYNEWGNDYIWLPSATETGMTNYIKDGSSIWKLTANQLSHSAQSYSWLRSGNSNYYYYAYYLQSSGAYNSNSVSTTRGVRPALHLNLSSAALGAAGATLKNPENVTTTYNGDVQTLASVFEAKPKEMGWYKAKWYEHTENYVAVTPQGTLQNAGSYWVKVELQQKWFDDMDALVEAQGAEQSWTADEIAAAKLRKRPKFKGEPDTSDAEHIESDRVRWFKFTINPKEITVKAPSYNSSTGVFVAPSFEDEDELCADAPVLATKFTGDAADGTPYSEIDQLPNRRGTYTAQAIFVNSAQDKTEYKGNYVIKNASEIKCTVVINRSRIAIVKPADTSKPYTGEKVLFALSGYSTEWTDVAILDLPDGVELEGSDSTGWQLAVTDADTYTVTLSIKADKKTDWCWNTENFSEEIVTDRTFTVTVSRKVLTVDFTSTSGGFLLQSGAEVTFGAGHNALSRDTVKLTLEYYNAEHPETKFSVPSDGLDASTLTPGSYCLVATLSDTEAAGNKNYKIEGGEARQEFTVSAKNITIESVDWQYSQNNGIPVSIAAGAGASSTTPVEVTYNGSAFIFALNTNGLEAAGVKVDVKYGTNGYANSSQLNATPNAVAVTVRIVPFDAGFAFNDANGKPVANQYKDFTVYVKVNKANVDFSNVVWSAEELEYNATNQTVYIKSGLPSFLTATYNSGATATNVNDYTAKVTGLTVKSDAASTAASANYNIPTSSQISAESKLTHNWSIVKKRIEVTWVQTETTQDGNVIFLPSISDNSTGAIEYTYWNADKTQQMTLQEIFDDYDATTTKDYYVRASLKASGGSYNATNCVLVEASQEVTESYQSFQAGENKNPVHVSLKVNKVTYNKQAQPAVIEVEGGGLTTDDIVVSYKQNGTACGVPQNAGQYKVIVSLNKSLEGGFAITGECEFVYEIEKASYDVTAMKWVDTENDNEEYTEPYVYAYGVTHTLAFTGDDIDGLNVNYTPETEGNLQGGDAKEYAVTVTFTVIDALNYNVPEDIEFTWEITPYTPDLSSVSWNYTSESPFVFTIENGVPVLYSVYLEGIPEGLEELIEYSGDTDEYSDAGSHITSFAIKEDDPARGNYGALVFGAGLETRLVWEIKPLTVVKPTAKQTKTFCADGYTFAEITNLPEDWAQYFEVEVVDSEKNDVAPTDGTWIFKDVDRYQIKIIFKDGMNGAHGGSTDNVKWTDNGRIDFSLVLTVEKLVLEASGWTDDPEGYAKPTINADTTEIETYFDYVLKNKETGVDVALNEKLEYETTYTIALKLKEEFSGNVAVKYLGHEVETTTPYGFLTGVDPLADDPEFFYRKPTGTELNVTYKYTGEEITFKLGNWFDETKMQILSGDLAGTDEGVYQVRIGFKKGANSAWGDLDDYDRSPVTVNYIISADAKSDDKFVPKDGLTPPYKYQYGDFTEELKIGDYVYSADNPLFITRLALGDTLADLIATFENGSDIKAFDADGKEITDLSTALATGMILRLMDGDTVLNQLTLSVLGDINGDGKVNVQDKTQLNAQVLRKISLDGAKLLACDVNGDGKINVQDKTLLNAQVLRKRDIYEGLSLKTKAASYLAAPIAPVQNNETVKLLAVDFEEVTAEITSRVEEPLALSFGEETAVIAYRVEENNGAVKAAEEKSDNAMRVCNVSFHALIEEKRYAICNRRESI